MSNAWFPLETLEKYLSNSGGKKTMFIAIAFDVEGVASAPYTTDPYCVWKVDDLFARWPHPFPPTHWCPIPSHNPNDRTLFTPTEISFPTALRKMWSGSEVEEFLKSHGPLYKIEGEKLL